jgi:intracellular septation protein A
MNKVLKIYPFITLILSSLIIVGIGHGIAPIGLFEPASLLANISGKLETQSAYEYDIYIAATVLLMGQTTLLISFFLKRKLKHILEILGILVLLIGYYIIAFPFNDVLRWLSFTTGIPFLAFALITLTSSIIKIKKRTD